MAYRRIAAIMNEEQVELLVVAVQSLSAHVRERIFERETLEATWRKLQTGLFAAVNDATRGVRSTPNCARC